MGASLVKLMLVEDEIPLQRALTEILADVGHNATSLESAEAALDALEAAGNALPDIVLTDLRLPGMSGLELVSLMHKHEMWKKIPVICLSASIPPELEHPVADAAELRFVRKPFGIPELLETIQEMVT